VALNGVEWIIHKGGSVQNGETNRKDRKFQQQESVRPGSIP